MVGKQPSLTGVDSPSFSVARLWQELTGCGLRGFQRRPEVLVIRHRHRSGSAGSSPKKPASVRFFRMGHREKTSHHVWSARWPDSATFPIYSRALKTVMQSKKSMGKFFSVTVPWSGQKDHRPNRGVNDHRQTCRETREGEGCHDLRLANVDQSRLDTRTPILSTGRGTGGVASGTSPMQVPQAVGQG